MMHNLNGMNLPAVHLVCLAYVEIRFGFVKEAEFICVTKPCILFKDKKSNFVYIYISFMKKEERNLGFTPLGITNLLIVKVALVVNIVVVLLELK
jgi:hypothetical protein